MFRAVFSKMSINLATLELGTFSALESTLGPHFALVRFEVVSSCTEVEAIQEVSEVLFEVGEFRGVSKSASMDSKAVFSVFVRYILFVCFLSDFGTPEPALFRRFRPIL